METCKDSKQAEQWKKELLECRGKDFKRVLEICSILEEYANQTEDKQLLGFVYFYKGEAYYVLNEVEDMFACMAESVPYLNTTGQWELLTRAYNMMAIVSINRGHAPVALDYYLTALQYAKQHGIDSVICSIHINLGYLYMQNKLYEDAKHHFFEAHQICSREDKKPQIGRLSMIYTNLTTCYMLCKDMEHAQEYKERLTQECSAYFNSMDKVYVGCMTARYYHLCNEQDKRDAVIQQILEQFDKQLPILDLFDDLYNLCELTLEIQAYDIFERLIEELEPVVLHTGMANLQRKLLHVQIRYYEAVKEEEKYLQAVSRFYKLVDSMEEESYAMIANMMRVRTALERMQESKREIEEMNVVLRQKSQTDPLSGLTNRYCMMDTFEQMLEECRQEQKPLGIAIMDIDYFKEYNDNYGHHPGDECIKKVASVIRAMQSEQVVCVRYGGDEFVALFCGIDRQDVLDAVQKLRTDVMELHIEHLHSKAAEFVTVTQGVCISVPTPQDKCLDFLRMADEYLYKVKRKERNHIGVGDIQQSYFMIV